MNPGRRGEIEIRHPESGAAVPVGEPGEICIRTAQLTAGYWKRPREAEAVLDPEGCYRSGDVGHRDAEDYLYVTDRVKDTIVSGGENVDPAEVERVLVEHPDVREAAVLGVPDER